MSRLIEVLHSVSNKLTEVSEELQIYQILNDGIKEILPDSYFLITKLQPNDMNFRITHSFGFDKYFTALKTLIGKDPFQMDFAFGDLSESKQKEFENRKLYHFQGGIYDATNRKLNKTICKTIEKILGISEAYAVSFCIDEKYFGGATFFIPQSTISSGRLNEDCILTIESLAAQASFAINKLRDLDALAKKENELAIAQSKFNQLVNQLSDIVWVANGDGTEIIDLNNSFEKYFGYSEVEFVKNPNLWSDIVHEDDKEIALKSGNELATSGNAECEYRIIKADGTILWIHERKSIVYDINGNPVQMGGVASDITEKKLLEQELRLKDHALENSPNATVMTDLNGYITYNNNGFLKLFRYRDKKEVIGRHISEFAASGDYKDIALEKLRNGEVYINEVTPIRKDGTVFNSIGVANPVKHEQKIVSIMAVFVDISKLKEMEAKLKRSEAKLLKSNQEKDTFFAIIAHDLRSPFNGMLGLLEILHDDYRNYDDEQRSEMVQASLYSAQKVFALLSDLLEWARLQNDHVEMNVEQFSINEVVTENINLYLNDAERKGIFIENTIDASTLVNTDLYSVNTVIRNLLINAIKFTQSGGCIIFSLKQINSSIEISIKDTGIGMSEDAIDKLFKLDESISMPGTNDEKGTGLGLLICKGIIEKNNWEIEVESQLGVGSTFRLILPRR